MKRRSKTYSVPLRRRRENKTDYRKRLKLLKSKTPRFVVRKSLNATVCQIVKYDTKGDVTVVTATSTDLKKQGWKGHGGNISSAYLTGYLCGLKAKKKKIKDAVLDAGLYRSTKGSRIYAALKGALDAGLEIPHSDKILPKDDRISGRHVEEYAKKLSTDKDKYNIIFSYYIKNKLSPESITKHFTEVKSKLKA